MSKGKKNGESFNSDNFYNGCFYNSIEFGKYCIYK